MESGVISTLGCYLNKYGSGEATMESPLLIAQIISQGETNFIKEIASMIFFPNHRRFYQIIIIWFRWSDDGAAAFNCRI